jgi:predicted kinase
MLETFPSVVIYRGLPGTGKSYMIEDLRRCIPTQRGLVFSADNFWLIDGQYIFDPKRIGEAHAWCFRRYLEALQDGNFDYYIVDNTNISAFEIAPYIQAANAYGLQSEIITVWCSLETAIKRNTHNVPATSVVSMYQRLLTEQLPPFWKHSVVLNEANNAT